MSICTNSASKILEFLAALTSPADRRRVRAAPGFAGRAPAHKKAEGRAAPVVDVVAVGAPGRPVSAANRFPPVYFRRR